MVGQQRRGLRYSPPRRQHSCDIQEKSKIKDNSRSRSRRRISRSLSRTPPSSRYNDRGRQFKNEVHRKNNIRSSSPRKYRSPDRLRQRREASARTSALTRPPHVQNNWNAGRRRSASPLLRRDLPHHPPTKLPRQRRSLSPRQRRSVSPRQKRSVSPRQKRSVSPRQRRSVSPRQRRSVSPRQRRLVSPRQKRSVSPRQKRSVSPRQKRIASPREKWSISPRQKRSVSPQQMPSTSRQKRALSPREKRSISPRLRKPLEMPHSRSARKSSPLPRIHERPSFNSIHMRPPVDDFRSFPMRIRRGPPINYRQHPPMSGRAFYQEANRSKFFRPPPPPPPPLGRSSYKNQLPAGTPSNIRIERRPFVGGAETTKRPIGFSPFKLLSGKWIHDKYEEETEVKQKKGPIINLYAPSFDQLIVKE